MVRGCRLSESGLSSYLIFEIASSEEGLKSGYLVLEKCPKCPVIFGSKLRNYSRNKEIGFVHLSGVDILDKVTWLRLFSEQPGLLEILTQR